MTTATYRNKATGQTATLSGDLVCGETLLEFAWGRGLRTVATINGWNRYDVEVTAAS